MFGEGFRSGTFDTGKAQVDKRGSIRRGDVELPIVDEASVRQQSSDKSHNDSGLDSQSSADKNRSPSIDKSLSSITARSAAAEELGADQAENQASPRYVDHNKLFPDADTRYEALHRRVNQNEERLLNSSYLSDGERKKRPISDLDSSDSPAANLSREAVDADKSPRREKDKRKHSVRDAVDRQAEQKQADHHLRAEGASSVASPRKKPRDGDKTPVSPNRASRNSVHDAKIPAGDAAETSRNERSAIHDAAQQGLNTSGQQLAKHTALARLKAPKSEEQNSVSDCDRGKGSPRESADHRASPRSQGQGEHSHTPPLAGSLTKKLQQTPHVQQKPDLKRTPRVHEDVQDSPRVQKQPHVRDTPQVQQKQQHVHQTPREPHRSHEQQKDHVQKTPRTQETPVVQSSPGSPRGQGDREAENPASIVIPRLSVETKVPTESTQRSKADQSSKSPSHSPNRTEHLKTNVVKGKAWDQPSPKPETAKESPAKPAHPKAAKPSHKNSDVSSTEASEDKKSKPTMALAEERTARHGGDTLAGLTAERDQLLRAERTYKQRILQLEEEVKGVVKQSQELSSENKALRTKLEAYEDKAYGGSHELKELRREKQELVGMVAKVTAEKQDVDAENERLKARLQEVEGKSKQWDNIYVENNKLKTKQAELEKKIQDLEKEKNGLSNNLKTAESKQLDKLAAVQNENKKIQAELINLQTKNSSLERKNERLEAENKEILERLEQKRNELDELMRAMNTETAAETEVKELHSELDTAQNKISDYKRELDEANRRYQNAEKEKDSTKAALRSKESECKTLKANLDEKDSQISDLKRQVDASKRNVKRLEDEMEDAKQVEKDAINMKARIRSLKNEIEDSLAANHKMKQERTDARQEADRLNRELASAAESLTEAKRYIKKLEGDRVSREKQDEELKVLKKREQELEHQLFDLNVRNDHMKQKVRELQEDKEDLLKTRSGVTEVEGVNRKLQDENRKLRQMLVERNMELAHRQSERKALVHRVDNLERKQNDSDIKVQQLKNWVTPYNDQPRPPPQPAAEALLALPPVPSHGAPRASKPGVKGRKKGKQQQQQQNQLNRSWEDMKRMEDLNDSVHTTPSLPVVLDSKFAHVPPVGGTGPPGYYDMYKHKMKLIRERRW
nr:hypothetical protein BaRGS_000358 [Batillaria attramentaria]